MRGPPLYIGSDNGLIVSDLLDEFDLDAGEIESASVTFAILDDYRDAGGTVITGASGSLAWSAANGRYEGTVEDGASLAAFDGQDVIEEISINAGTDRLAVFETVRRVKRREATQ